MRVVWFKTLTLTAAIAASSSAFAVTLEGGAVAAPDQYGAEVAAPNAMASLTPTIEMPSSRLLQILATWPVPTSPQWTMLRPI